MCIMVLFVKGSLYIFYIILNLRKLDKTSWTVSTMRTYRYHIHPWTLPDCEGMPGAGREERQGVGVVGPVGKYHICTPCTSHRDAIG